MANDATAVSAAPEIAIIDVRDLKKRYPIEGRSGEFLQAVGGVSLAISEGEIFGILGPNGAGKTTTLEMIEGLTDIDEGSAVVCGIDVSKDPYSVKQQIGVQLQSNDFFERLSLKELLELFSGLYGEKDVDIRALLGEVGLEDKLDEKPDNLSGGQRQRFTVACALVHKPRVLFLDEPTTGLDPQAKRNLWQLIRGLNDEGMTIVLTTHNMEEAESLCERIAIMDHGHIVAEGTPKDLILEHAPVPPEARLHGTLEDVFLVLTGHELRDE